jgi:hypothetical protein
VTAQEIASFLPKLLQTALRRNLPFMATAILPEMLTESKPSPDDNVSDVKR